VLHAFTSGNDGSAPFAGLIMGKQGKLYGTTWGGGAHKKKRPHYWGHSLKEAMEGKSGKAMQGADPAAGPA